MDFTESWGDSCSAISYAIRLGDMTLFDKFLKENRPVDVSDNRGWFPLHEAAAASHSLECLEKLLNHDLQRLEVPVSGEVPYSIHVQLAKCLVTLLVKEEFNSTMTVLRYANHMGLILSCWKIDAG
ncbi:UNVERIFIED_CONTAM: Ankyrin repeat and SOCS box protein 3 [Trichonephila clavipes]